MKFESEQLISRLSNVSMLLRNKVLPNSEGLKQTNMENDLNHTLFKGLNPVNIASKM